MIEIENIFEFCYELDENEKPERYRLKYLEKIIPNYKEKVTYARLCIVCSWENKIYLIRLICAT
jgi:hypothetical protein